MAYTLIDNYGTQFAVDWDVVARLNESFRRAEAQWNYADIKEMSESSIWNPFSWSMPTVRTVDVDWQKVRERARQAGEADMIQYRQLARTDMRSVAEEMRYRVEQTTVRLNNFKTLLRDVQHQNAMAIQQSVEDYDGLIETSRFIRDTSADVVAVGSTIATGGAAAGLLVGSSAMKGMAKYQDTGNAGAALLQGGGSLVLGVFKVSGAKLTTGGEFVLIIAKGALESGTSLVAGDSFGTAIEKGGLKIASAGAAQAVFGNTIAKQVFQRMPLPFTIWGTKVATEGGWMRTDVADRVVAGASKKIFERVAKGEMKSALHGSAPPAPRTRIAGLADEVPLDKKFLLYFSIVNMEKGIGRGW